MLLLIAPLSPLFSSPFASLRASLDSAATAGLADAAFLALPFAPAARASAAAALMAFFSALAAARCAKRTAAALPGNGGADAIALLRPSGSCSRGKAKTGPMGVGTARRITTCCCSARRRRSCTFTAAKEKGSRLKFKLSTKESLARDQPSIKTRRVKRYGFCAHKNPNTSSGCRPWPDCEAPPNACLRLHSNCPSSGACVFEAAVGCLSSYSSLKRAVSSSETSGNCCIITEAAATTASSTTRCAASAAVVNGGALPPTGCFNAHSSRKRALSSGASKGCVFRAEESDKRQKN